jgi:hypothetical protein
MLARLSAGERMIAVASQQGTIVFVSPDAHLVLGALVDGGVEEGPCTLVGRSVLDLLGPADAADFLSCVSRRPSASSLLRCVDGAFLWLDASTVPPTPRLERALAYAENLRSSRNPAARRGSSLSCCASAMVSSGGHRVEDHVLTKQRPLTWWLMALGDGLRGKEEEGRRGALQSNRRRIASSTMLVGGPGECGVPRETTPPTDMSDSDDEDDDALGASGRDYSFTEVFNFISRTAQARQPAVGSFCKVASAASMVSVEGPDAFAERLRSTMVPPEELGWMQLLNKPLKERAISCGSVEKGGDGGWGWFCEEDDGPASITVGDHGARWGR